MWLSRKKRRAAAARLGFLNHLIIGQRPNVDEFVEATEILVALCIDLGINWDLVQDATRKYREIKESIDGKKIQEETRSD